MRHAALACLALLSLTAVGCTSIYEVPLSEEISEPKSGIHQDPGILVYGYVTKDGERRLGPAYLAKRSDGVLVYRALSPVEGDPREPLLLSPDKIELILVERTNPWKTGLAVIVGVPVAAVGLGLLLYVDSRDCDEDDDW
jgi:hypothetical protein